jgi:hypothetical protein
MHDATVLGGDVHDHALVTAPAAHFPRAPGDHRSALLWMTGKVSERPATVPSWPS